jgi:hypothetical protein
MPCRLWVKGGRGSDQLSASPILRIGAKVVALPNRAILYRGGAPSRWLVCLKAEVEAGRRDREARPACAGVPMPGNTKAKTSATCKTAKPLGNIKFDRARCARNGG